VQLSIGLGTTRADIDRLADALEDITVSGPRWTLPHVARRQGLPAGPPDPRPRRALAFELT
jgi:hypothetical protein